MQYVVQNDIKHNSEKVCKILIKFVMFLKGQLSVSKFFCVSIRQRTGMCILTSQPNRHSMLFESFFEFPKVVISSEMSSVRTFFYFLHKRDKETDFVKSFYRFFCVRLPAGKLWSRSIKLAYNILHKLGSKQEPMVRPGDRVSHALPPSALHTLDFCFCSFC